MLPACSVGQRMVLGKPHDQHGSLVDESGVELGLAKPGSWRVQSRVGEVKLGHSCERVDVEPGDLRGDR
jgi:hypothetical protein